MTFYPKAAKRSILCARLHSLNGSTVIIAAAELIAWEKISVNVTSKSLTGPLWEGTCSSRSKDTLFARTLSEDIDFWKKKVFFAYLTSSA